MNEKRYLDRNHKLLKTGDLVRCKHCVGRYGDTRTVTGTIQSFDKFGNMRLTLVKETRPFTVFGRGGYAARKVGPGSTYSCGAFRYDHKLDADVGYYRHDSYEHGHEAWVELIEQGEEP